MTKTLTEQWREGTLPDGAYYILVDKYEQNEPEIDVGVCYNSNFEWWIVKEVLEPVPTYEEYNELLRHSELSRNLVYEVLVNQKEYNELLDKAKENKRLQEQLKEANEVISIYRCYDDTKCGKATEYCKKWGVK